MSRSHKTYLPLPEKNNFIKVQVYYDLGGMSYATYKQKPRGYYLSAGPVKREETAWGYTEAYGMLSASCWLLEETKRLQPKRFEELIRTVEAEIAAKSGPQWDRIQSMMPKQEVVT